MTKIANILIVFLLGLLILNGLRLTFFPRHACNLVRSNEIVPIEQSIMDFHRDYPQYGGPTE